MDRSVKGDQDHVSGRALQARTRAARQSVIDAARSLFVERGYAATTVEALSERSDVPAATVYRLFSSKVGVLKALLDVSIAGDDRPVAVPERPEVASLHGETDPRALLAGFAAVVVGINQRTTDTYRVLCSAAGSDPDAAQLLTAVQRQRDQGQRQFARTLARTGRLRRGLGERHAADVIHALASPELYRLLVADRRWSPARYRRWLADILAEQLIEPAAD